MQSHYATTNERLTAVANLLLELDAKRQQTGDDSLGRAVESFLVNRELRELEHFALVKE